MTEIQGYLVPRYVNSDSQQCHSSSFWFSYVISLLAQIYNDFPGCETLFSDIKRFSFRHLFLLTLSNLFLVNSLLTLKDYLKWL
jgi:hypothetical protein